MLDKLNIGTISGQTRKDVVIRSVYAQPYFYKIEIPITAGASALTQFGNSIGINRDFYLTEIQTNLGEVFTDTGSLFNMAVWTNFGHSIYRYGATDKLPNSFIAYDARFDTPLGTQIFDDRQQEFSPFLIKNNDKVFVEIENLSAKLAGSTAYIVLKGFNLLSGVYVNDIETQQINESLARPVQPQFFKFNVEEEGRRTFTITNDNTPRLILGCGFTNVNEAKALVPEATVSIQDVSRRINITDTAIPIEFIAPRLTCLLDQVRYWLPIEHYLQPFGKITFDVESTFAIGGDGFEFNILTRNV